MKLTPEFVSILLKALRDEKLSNEDKSQIREIIKKSEEGDLKPTDYLMFVKAFYCLSEILQKFLE